ncbi:MAG: membrane or secreted protein [Pirellulales bacterium]
MRRFALIASLIGFVTAGGCATTETPQFYTTRSSQEQQAAAQRFDPYPETDVGPQALGSRPRDYQKPVAEPSRARWDPTTWISRWRGSAAR